MSNRPTSRSPVVDHLGLVAGLFDGLALGDIPDQTTQQHPTVGAAVNTMVLHGLGFINQALSLVPLFFRNEPTSRPHLAPCGPPAAAR